MGNIIRGNDFGKLLLRLTVGIFMLFHGAAKVSTPGPLEFIKGQVVNSGWPEVLAYGVYVGEILAPLMIIVGIYARFGGLIIVINMFFAIVLVHANALFSLGEHGGWALELQGFYLSYGLAVLFLGSGKFAVKPD